MEEKNKKLGYVGALVFFALMTTGCSSDFRRGNDMKNVEERDYATILLVTEGENRKDYRFVLGIAQEKKKGEKSMTEEVSSWDCDTFSQLEEEYQTVKGKDLSLSHLKVILLSLGNDGKKESGAVEVFTDTGILNLLDENEEIAKTCPVLQLAQKEEFLSYLEKEEMPVGNYLENVIRESEEKNLEIPWLKDYLKAVREQKGLEIYMLQPVSQGWKVVCTAKTTF